MKEREAALLTLHAIQADLEKRRHAIAAVEAEGAKVIDTALFVPVMLHEIPAVFALRVLWGGQCSRSRSCTEIDGW